MRKLLSIAFYFVLLNASAQSLFFQNPVPVPNTQGYLWPRIVYTNNHPFITWGSAFPFNLYGSSLIGGSFTTPIQLNPVGYEPYIQSWTGPEMDAISDTVFVVFTDVNTQTAHVYAVRSIDGGLSFSDTIRVDFLSTDVPRFPNVTLRPGGNPLINFLRFDQNMANQSYVVSRSDNGGISFLPDVNATSILAAKPCDCCPGYITADENKVAVVFRNSVNNQRDFNTGLSFDTASTFSAGAAVDTNNWIIGVCPSSGPSALFRGDSLISVFMNGASGNSRVYLSTINVNTQQIGQHRQIFSNAGGNQNVPRLAGSGDTLGLVWDQTFNGGRMIMFTHSTTGASGLGVEVDTIAWGNNTFLSNPDIAYHNGVFHITYSNISTLEVFYSSVSFGNPQSLADNSAPCTELNVVTNTVKNEMEISTTCNFNTSAKIALYDLNGRQVFSTNLKSIEKHQSVYLDKNITPGIYLLEIAGTNFKKSLKVKF